MKPLETILSRRGEEVRRMMEGMNRTNVHFKPIWK
jgi:hypothetical protein